MTQASYHFLLTSMNAYGPVNAALGFGELLTKHGHKVTFTHLPKFKESAVNRGFGFIEFNEKLFTKQDSLIDLIDSYMDKFHTDPMVRFANFTQADKEVLGDISEWTILDQVLTEVIERININDFDAIVHDYCDLTAAIFKTGLPVINLHSCNPLGLYENGPPFQLGLSNTSDRQLWTKMKGYILDSHELAITRMNEYLSKVGRPPNFLPLRLALPLSYIGFYHFPEQLDYKEYEPIAPGWNRIDCFIRSSESAAFEIPENLKDKPGSLIYFSLGSTASNDIKFMQRILDALAKSPNRFIISKGFRGDQLKLADNMWGADYLDQIAVLKSVDLVITHGGNNTFMESLFYGKLMIVIGYYFDQLDNAQRVVDKGIGFRIRTWDFDENYLLECIEKALGDEEMKKKIAEISESMRNSDSVTKAVNMIVDVIEKSKCKSTQ